VLRVLGLEWLWILAQQPAKWRVYSLDAARFSLAIMRLKRRIS
jgi:UDP-N-acetyl-D-mannosaminuronic acid transferase (WecB/TagA/CpsF family)